MRPLAGKRILDLSAQCAQQPHALAAAMAGKLCALYGAEVVRPDGPMIDPTQPLGRFLDAGKQPPGAKLTPPSAHFLTPPSAMPPWPTPPSSCASPSSAQAKTQP